ncbi:NADH:flavin oxidoreductase [Pantoea agglomerans]|uniref:oxidoreductase n=1 Tax=Enterobacter agglomerans TaxID=549 RepID=UPI001A90F50C|nr:NADH:flavin oxidoreductase [Pantoea agglomerans]MBO0639823.1 NADH:flavin oxidoreductase [Pantoea agglomerans]
MHYSSLYEATSINGTPFRNRVMVAPMTRISASESGVPGKKMQDYYTRFARGGFGAIITEGIYIDQAWSQTYAFQPGIVNEAQISGWKDIVEETHKAGARVIAQLIHAGALSQKNIYRPDTVGSSAVKPKGQQLEFYYGSGEYRTPVALSEEQIRDIITSFADSAERAISDAKFDGVEIHAANGYLLDQFLTDYTNQRTDKWGGALENRLAVTLEVIRAVRSKIGAGKVLGVRVSQGKVNDFHHKWKEGEAGARTIFALLADAGVDYIHVTEYKSWLPAFENGEKSLVEIAREVAPETVIIANGGLDDGAMAEKLVDMGADFVSIGKAALANPDWPGKVAAGLPLQDLPEYILSPVADIKEKERF